MKAARWRTVRRGAWVGLACTAAVLAQGSARPNLAKGWWIGEITPSGKMLIFFDVGLRTQPKPKSGMQGDPVSLTPSEFASAAARSIRPHAVPPGLALGNRWDAFWQGSRHLAVRVAGFAAVRGDYGWYLGAWLDPEQDGRPALAEAGAGPFLARPASAMAATADASLAPAFFDPGLSPREQAYIGATLTRRMLQELPHFSASDQAAKDNAHAPLDAALLVDPGQPKLSIQGVRLADGNSRLFVRAEWDAQRISGFLLSAWFTDEPTPRILSVDLDSARQQRDSSPGGFPEDQTIGLIPPLLRVIYLGNGATGVLRGDSQYEGVGVELFAYSDSTGLVPTYLFYDRAVQYILSHGW